MYSQVILLLEDPLSRHSQVVILSPIDKTVSLWSAIILAIWKISVNHWKLPCWYKYFDCGIWLKTVQITKCSDNQGLDNRGTTVVVISILWTFLVSFYPLVTFTFPEHKFSKTSMLNHCVSTLGLVIENGSIDSESKGTMLETMFFAMQVYVSAPKQKMMWTRHSDPS